MSDGSTTIEFLAGKSYTAERHEQWTTRYFNGRMYRVCTAHTFMSRPVDSDWERKRYNGDRAYWMVFSRYVCLYPGSPWISSSWKTYKARSVSTGNQPSVLQRTMDAMVPDDIQTVPF